MGDEAKIFEDPAFQELLRQRSRLRWSFSGLIVGAYFLFGLCGLIMPAAYGGMVLGGTISLGLLLGYGVITTSIVLSLIYIRSVNRLEEAHQLHRSAAHE